MRYDTLIALIISGGINIGGKRFLFWFTPYGYISFSYPKEL